MLHYVTVKEQVKLCNIRQPGKCQEIQAFLLVVMQLTPE